MNSTLSPNAIIDNEANYVESEFSLSFPLSTLQAFLLTLTAELGDKTFIMLIILQLKANKITIFFSSLITQLLMSIIASCLGFAIKHLLYKNFIDYVGMLSFILYSLWLIGDSFNSTEQSFEKDLELPNDQIEQEKKIKSNKNASNLSLSKHLDVIEETLREEDPKFNDEEKSFKVSIRKIGIKDEENDEDKEEDKEEEQEQEELEEEEEEEKENSEKIKCKIFWVIMKSMALSECGDRTQLTAMTMAAVFNFYGVIIGSCCALFVTVYLGVYMGKHLIKYLHEKTLNFIVGIILLIYGIQIFYGKS